MGVRRGVLLGKKDFKIQYQESFEQEFLRAFYASNQIPREIILSKECWADEEEKPQWRHSLNPQGAHLSCSPFRSKGEKHEMIGLANKNIEANMEQDSSW